MNSISKKRKRINRKNRSTSNSNNSKRTSHVIGSRNPDGCTASSLDRLIRRLKRSARRTDLVGKERKEGRRKEMSNHELLKFDPSGFFTREELEKLFLNFLRNRKYFIEDEVYSLVRRLAWFRSQATLVELAIDGTLNVDWSEEEQDVLFSMSSGGTRPK